MRRLIALLTMAAGVAFGQNVTTLEVKGIEYYFITNRPAPALASNYNSNADITVSTNFDNSIYVGTKEYIVFEGRLVEKGITYDITITNYALFPDGDFTGVCNITGVLDLTEYQITKAKDTYREDHPVCESCGLKKSFFNGKNLPVHHLIPVHVNRSLAATQTNLITLCPWCHFKIGHFGNYKDHNLHVRQTIKRLNKEYEMCKEEYLIKDKKEGGSK